MTQLNLQAQWRDTIEQIETGDRVLGGANGKINQIFTALGDRTEYLKHELKTTAITSRSRFNWRWRVTRQSNFVIG
ncbi:hypothetical protein ACNR0F_01830 [Kingella kingae]|uniref:hypothetical protein n=1 Tax=Kingella kingae TaxID=504 RepID=UPI003AB6AA9C